MRLYAILAKGNTFFNRYIAYCVLKMKSLKKAIPGKQILFLSSDTANQLDHLRVKLIRIFHIYINYFVFKVVK